MNEDQKTNVCAKCGHLWTAHLKLNKEFCAVPGCFCDGFEPESQQQEEIRKEEACPSS